jgi:hypothetical protein
MSKKIVLKTTNVKSEPIQNMTSRLNFNGLQIQKDTTAPMAYEYLEFKDKYTTIEESYDAHKEHMKQLIISKRAEGFVVFPLTMTFTGIKGRTMPWIREFLDVVQNRFHKRLSCKLSGKIFKNYPQSVPVLTTYVDCFHKKKNAALLRSVDSPHLHGFLIIHPFHRNKMNKLLGSGWIHTMWKKLKYERIRYCHDLDVRPIVTTLDKSIEYQAAFIKNPDYIQYIRDEQTPFFLKCYDPKVAQSGSYNMTNAC